MIAAFDICFEGAQRVDTTSTNQSVAKAIIGVDQLLTMGARALYGSLVDPEIDIRRDPEAVAYSVDLGFRKNFGMARRAQLAGVEEFINPDEKAVGRALGWIGGSLAGLFQLLKALGGKKVTGVKLLEDSVEVSSGEKTVRVSIHTYKLLRHIKVRRAVEKIAQVFDEESVEAISIRDRTTGAVTAEVKRSEAAFFTFPVMDEVVLVDEVCTRALLVPSSNYRDDQVWTFFDGEQTVRAKMCDKDFLRLIDHGVFRLNADDILVAKLHIKTVQTPAGLVGEWEVLKVIDHRKSGKHLPMPGI